MRKTVGIWYLAFGIGYEKHLVIQTPNTKSYAAA